jgi:phage tail-like protein
MATFRDRPYSQFNFLVNLGGDPAAPQAGFQEVTGLGLEITVAEYRAGNKKDSAPDKITGMHKVPDVTLKRGLIGALDLHEWLEQVRDGAQAASHRTVIISLLDEARSGPVQQWKLSSARPIKYTGPSLTGKGTDVAIEELVLACERIDFE